MNRDQKLDDWPILAPLSFFGMNQVRDAEEVIFQIGLIDKRRATFPHRGKVGRGPQPAHDIHPEPLHAAGIASEVDRMPTIKHRSAEWRHRNSPPLKLLNRSFKANKIVRFGQNQDIDVLANLRRAVEDAGLPAHEQGPDAMSLERRKDLSDRGRGQDCLPGRYIPPGSARSGRTAPAESAPPIPSIHRTCRRNSWKYQ